MKRNNNLGKDRTVNDLPEGETKITVITRKGGAMKVRGRVEKKGEEKHLIVFKGNSTKPKVKFSYSPGTKVEEWRNSVRRKKI